MPDARPRFRLTVHRPLVQNPATAWRFPAHTGLLLQDSRIFSRKIFLAACRSVCESCIQARNPEVQDSGRVVIPASDIKTRPNRVWTKIGIIWKIQGPGMQDMQFKINMPAWCEANKVASQYDPS